MKNYKIIEIIMLSFIVDNDQKDYLLEEGILQTDGSTIWYMYNGDAKESITTANAIALWEEQGKIKAI
jgi:hypothetical protein